MPNSSLTQIIEATNNIWSALQKNFDDLPDVLVVIGPDSGRRGPKTRYIKNGHFFRDRWQVGTEEAIVPFAENGSLDQGGVKQEKPVVVPEVLLVAEQLKRGAEATFETLVHEAAHALAFGRGIKDTDKTGRRHNKRFKALAEELGLVCSDAEGDSRGWAYTAATPELLATYKSEIDALGTALEMYRIPPALIEAKKNTNYIVITCECERKVRVAPSTLEQGEIVCGVCGTNFVGQEYDD